MAHFNKNGNLEAFKWAQGRNIRNSYWTVPNICSSGNLEFVKYIHSIGFFYGDSSLIQGMSEAIIYI